MAARIFLSRSKPLATAFTRRIRPSHSPIDPAASSHCLRDIHSLSSSTLPPDNRGSAGLASLSDPSSPKKFMYISSYPALYGQTRDLPLWSFAWAQNRGMKHQAENYHPAVSKSTAEEHNGQTAGEIGGKAAVGCNQLVEEEVISFSPLEGATVGKRALSNESSKIKRFELSQKITFALIPVLLLVSKNSLTTSLLIFSVYWQIYGFFKEIFLDYVHQEVTRKWVLIYFQLLLLILAKDTILYFNLV